MYVSHAGDYELTTLRPLVSEYLDCFLTHLHPGASVVLKPNLLMKRTPDEATTTHPALVEAVVLELQARGVSDILLADSPSGPFSPKLLNGIYRATGMADVAQRTGIRLNYDTSFVTRSTDGAVCREFNIITPLAEADCIINLCKMKTHGMTNLSGAVKNLFGSVPGLQKPELHFRFSDRRVFSGMLVDLACLVRPALTICDAVTAMEGNGPSGGSARHVGRLACSDDVFALDLALAGMMGLALHEAYTVREAHSRGLCPGGVAQLELLGSGYCTLPDFKKPNSREVNFAQSVPRFLRGLYEPLQRRLAPRPVIQKNCIGCGACAQICPAHTIAMRDKKAQIDYSACIRCYCCHEVCPVKAIEIGRFKPPKNRA